MKKLLNYEELQDLKTDLENLASDYPYLGDRVSAVIEGVNDVMVDLSDEES